jgi:threonine dehydrogenase-like Zn-dependent dehydrogenase
MGYSLAGVVDALGAEVTHLAVGDRVVALAPHAQYVVRGACLNSPKDQPQVFPLTPEVTWDQAPYWPLAAGAVSWVEIADIQRDDTVVILGQGLVGSLMLQVAKANGRGQIVAVDALDLRCDLADKLGADVVINAAERDLAETVRSLTNGVGADIVVYAVGGPAGPRAFEQAQDLLAAGGLVHLVGLYEDQPLPLYSSKIQGRRLLGGYYGRGVDAAAARRAMELLGSGAIQSEVMTTHRFPYAKAAEAFDLLYNRPQDAMGVVFDWGQPDA